MRAEVGKNRRPQLHVSGTTILSWIVHISKLVATRAVVDTSGAGDTFYAGLVPRLLKGLTPYAAGRLAAATGATCVTAAGGTTAICTFNETVRLTGISPDE